MVEPVAIRDEEIDCGRRRVLETCGIVLEWEIRRVGQAVPR